jgi:far upstream element-binding protein
MHAQANAIEAQIKTRGASGAAAPTSAPGMMPGNYERMSSPYGNKNPFNISPGQNVPQQPQAAPSGGQDATKDYSTEWAAYYRQIGRVDEAEAIERQIKVSVRKSINLKNFRLKLMKPLF